VIHQVMTDSHNAWRRARQRRGRPPVQKEAVESYVRELVVSGRLKPGDSVPTRRGLAAQFDASPVTVQAAVAGLVREGFLTVRSQRTFVSENSPHLCRYAVVLPVARDEIEKNRFWKALVLETERIRDREGRDIRIYFDVNGGATSPGEVELLEDVARRRLAGIIFASAPFLLKKSPILRRQGIARVAFMTPAKGYAGLSTITLSGFEARALALMAASGRKRVAVLCTPGVEEEWERRILKTPGIRMRKSWLQSVSQTAPQSARRCMWLLMDTARTERPDGLVITDDNLVEAATLGLKEAGARVPAQLQVIAHCNYPRLPHAHVPVEWVGYDARLAVKTAIEDLDRQIRKGSPPRRLSVGPVVGRQDS